MGHGAMQSGRQERGVGGVVVYGPWWWCAVREAGTRCDGA